MDTYSILKFLHIAVAIAWLGGAFSVILLGSLAAKSNDSERLIWAVRMTETLAKKIFMPSSLIILVLGAIMVWMDWSFAEAWVVFGILGVIMTGGIGGAILTPMVVKINESDPGPERDALAEKLLRTARADLIMLFVIVWAMVSRPQWSDVYELIGMVAVIVVGGALFLRK